MDLMAIAKEFPDMTVSIRLRDLLEANEALVRKVRQEAEQEQARRAKEYGDTLVPKAEAKKMLGSPDDSTLWRWEKKYNYLVPVKIGVKVFYRRSDIDALIRSKENNN